MNGNGSSSPLDAALAHVDPDRRRFLRMLLAGVAAAPLLTSADLIAENKSNFPKANVAHKTNSQTAHKGANSQLKVNNQQQKGANSQLKVNNQQQKGANSQLKSNTGAFKENTANTGALKSNTGALKSNTANTGALKANSGAIKNSQR
jgi:hypothetical protein